MDSDFAWFRIWNFRDENLAFVIQRYSDFEAFSLEWCCCLWALFFIPGDEFLGIRALVSVIIRLLNLHSVTEFPSLSSRSYSELARPEFLISITLAFISQYFISSCLELCFFWNGAKEKNKKQHGLISIMEIELIEISHLMNLAILKLFCDFIFPLPTNLSISFLSSFV